MAFDDSRGVTVLFGGEDTYSQPSSFFGDTWEWDGLAWSQANVTGPAARGRHTMVFDTHRARTVLFGGTTGTNGESDTWEYDGASWQQSPVIGPPWRFQHAMAFDEARRQMVMFGGFAPSGSNSGDTWTFSAPVNAAFTPIGQGCPGPAGTLQLHAVPGSLPILGQTFSMQVTNLPASIFAVPFGAVGFSNQSFAGAPLPAALDGIGAPGCTLFVSIDQEFVLANQSGTANWSIPVPFDLSLLGLDAYVQSAVLVPGFNPANLVVSNAGHVVVGSQ